MILTPELKYRIESDIELCKNHTQKNGSNQLYNELVARYSLLDENFKNNLSSNGKAALVGEEFDYRDELKAIASKLEMWLLLGTTSTNLESMEKPTMSKSKIFIVHGHDNAAKQEVARTLEKGGFEAIILDENASENRTIIEKIEHYSDAPYAVVLYTECDLGRDKNKPADSEQFRARQNVIFKHGYLIGKLGRKNVCALIKGSIEISSDIEGMVYVTLDNSGAWKMKLANELDAAWLPVDRNTLCR